MGATSCLRDSFFSCSSDEDLSDNDDITLRSKPSNCQEFTDWMDNCIRGRLSLKQNIIFKLFNRERNEYFTENAFQKKKKNAFSTVPSRLSVCLLDIVPFCYLKGHIFLGLTACGKFLLSYKVVCDSDLTENNYDFSTTYKYKYELFFWIYRPYNLLTKYYKVCLFDDHGVNYLEVVTLAQWNSIPRTVVVHGASDEFDNEDSYLTILSVPKLGCLDCKKLRDEYYADSLDGCRSAALCIRCSLTIHTKYTRSESDPKFNPKINLNCPERLVIFSDGLIHVINVQLELNKLTKNFTNNCADVSYIGKREKSTLIVETSHLDLRAVCDNKTNKSSLNDCEIDKKNSLSLSSSSMEKRSENHSKNGQKENIVARIIADFTEYESDVQEKSQRIRSNVDNGVHKHYDQLIISCGSSSTSIGSGISIPHSTNRVRLISHRSHRLLARSLISPATSTSSESKSTLKTIDLQTSSSSTSAYSNKNFDKAAKAYEFSEDNEKCEKISTFRKRRLADKKYEFSEDNLENIIPFTKLRNRKFPPLVSSRRTSRPSTMSMSPTQTVPYTNNNGIPIFNTPLSNSAYEQMPQIHSHRASPSHGFRSPCGSPVGNRFLMSPPGGRATSNFVGRSPTYSRPFSSPRNFSRKSYLDLCESVSNPVLSQCDDYDIYKLPSLLQPQQPLSEVKPSNGIDSISTVTPLFSTEKLEKYKPNCSKKLIRRYVEEDDATSVITSEDDDCISPGYHTSLPMEVHGACYSTMQMVSQTSLQQIKGPSVTIIQQTFDLEILTYHIANYLCSKNNKNCGFFNDWAYAPVNICPLSCTLTCVLVVNFTAKEQKPTDNVEKQCANCMSSQHTDCVIHRQHFEISALFTWNIETGDWHVLDYGDLIQITSTIAFKQQQSGELINVVKRMANEFSSSGLINHDIFNEIRVLDSCTDKSKNLLTDNENSIEFYRTARHRKSYSDDFCTSDFD